MSENESDATPVPVRFCRCVATRYLRANVHNNICPRCTGRIPHDVDESLEFNDTESLTRYLRPSSRSITPPPEDTPVGRNRYEAQNTFQHIPDHNANQIPLENQHIQDDPETESEFEQFINRYTNRAQREQKANTKTRRTLSSSPIRRDDAAPVETTENMNIPHEIHPTRGLNELPVKIPLFSGKSDEDVESLLLNFDTYCHNTGKTEQFKASHIPLLLKGEAHSVFRNIPPESKASYEKICENLRLNFGVVKMPCEVAYPLLTKLKMTTTVQEYLNQFRKLCTNLHVTPNMIQAFFVYGLKPKVKQYVTIRQPKTLNEAIQYAKQGEAIAPEDETSTNDAAVKRLTEEVSKITSLLGTNHMHTANVNTAPKIDTCQLCFHSGHIATLCPRNVVHRALKERVCYNCRKPGHKIADCESMFGHHAHDATEYSSLHFDHGGLGESQTQQSNALDNQ